jgi:hypothetical protein
MRRVVLKSPVLENCTPGSVRGAPGNRRPYLAKMQKASHLPVFNLPVLENPPPQSKSLSSLRESAAL